MWVGLGIPCLDLFEVAQIERDLGTESNGCLHLFGGCAEEVVAGYALFGDFEESTIAKSVPRVHSDDGPLRHDEMIGSRRSKRSWIRSPNENSESDV